MSFETQVFNVCDFIVTLFISFSDFTDGISQSRKTGYDVRSGDWEMVCYNL